MSQFPTDPKKLRARIRDYERKLQREKEEHGAYDDGYGKRYLIGPMYLLAGDLSGALKSFRRYQKEFPDDGDETGQVLCWSLAFYRAGNRSAAERKLQQAMLMNAYVLPHLLGMKIEPTKPATKDDFDIDLMYLGYMPGEYFSLWTEEEKCWAAEMYESEEFRRARERS